MKKNDPPTPEQELLNELRSLKETLAEQASIAGLHDKLQGEVREHKEYLEALLNRTTKVLSIVGGAFVLVLGFFGIKTFSDLDEKVENTAQERVEQLINANTMGTLVDSTVLSYSRWALVSYLAVAIERAGPQEEGDDGLGIQLTEGEGKAFASILARPKDARFADALTVLSKLYAYRSFDGNVGTIRFADCGATLEKNLKALWTGGSTLGSEHQAAMIEALGRIEYKPAGPLLLERYSSFNTAREIQLAILKALPGMYEGPDGQVLQTLLKSQDERRDDPMYFTQLMGAVMRIDNSKVLPIFRDLVASKKMVDVGLFGQCMNIVQEDIDWGKNESEIVSLLARFLAHDSLGVSGPANNDPRGNGLVLLGSERYRPSTSLMRSSIFAEAVNRNFTHLSGKALERFFSITALFWRQHRGVVVREAARSHQSEPDPLSLIVELRSDPKGYGPMIVRSFRLITKDVTVSVSDPLSDTGAKEMQVSLDLIDLAKTTWTLNGL